MLGFSMIALTFFIAGIFLMLLIMAGAAAYEYEQAKRDERRNTQPKRASHEMLVFRDDHADDSLFGRSA
jgi:hypothetical protein